MTESRPLDLPPGWRSASVPSGVDLRIASSGRKCVVAAAAIFGFLAGWRAISHWSSVSATPWLVVAAMLTALALWCALGDEVWHLQRNCLVHQTGIGRWRFSRRFQDANLEIVQRFSAKWELSYYRLYAVANGKSSFLVERGEQELLQLAGFISRYTGWQVRLHGTPSPD